MSAKRVLIILLFLGVLCLQSFAQIRQVTANKDVAELKRLNEQFIKNFINQDTVAHNEIIHKDFVCIYSNGVVVRRDEYMKGWATGYSQGAYKTFDYTDEDIRIFGSVALVKSKTVYTKMTEGGLLSGSSVYTDTYLKEKGRWWCVQAQITPVK